MINSRYENAYLRDVISVMHQGINTAADKVVYVKSGVPIIQSKHFTSGKLEVKETKYLGIEDTEKYGAKYIPNNGDVLFSNIGTVGKSVVVDIDLNFMFAWNVFLMKPKHKIISNKYLQRYLDYLLKLGVYKRWFTGGTVKFLNKKTISGFEIPLPPLAEQKKIAAILDAADSLRQKDQQLIDHYTTLSQSLFLEMFGDPVGNKKGWKIKKIAEVTQSQLGKMLSKKSKQNINPKKYLRNANVRWRYFDLKDMLEMDFNAKEINKFNLIEGDLLVCEGGEVGRCAIWKEDLKDCYFQKALHRVRVDLTVLTPEYLQEYFYWMSKLGGLSSSVSEVTFSHLTAEKLKQLDVPIPPIALQNQFTNKMKAIEVQKQQAQASLEKSNDLFNSLLQRAFKGELSGSSRFNDNLSTTVDKGELTQ